MNRKCFPIIFFSLFILIIPLIAQSEGIPLQGDVLISSPVLAPEDLPDEITFTLYDSKTALEPIGYQTFTRGQYTIDFDFSKSDGISGGNVARVNAEFTNSLNLGESQPKEIWAAIEVAGAEVGDRSKVSDDTLVQLLLASDASIASYLTLVYEGNDNPIATIYKDMPLAKISGDGSQPDLTAYFSALPTVVAAGEAAIAADTRATNWVDSGANVYTTGNAAIGTASSSYAYPLQVGVSTQGSNVVAGGYATFGELRGGACFFGDNVITSTTVSNRMEIANTQANYGARAVKMFAFEGISFHTKSGAVTAADSFTSERMRIDNNGNVGIGTTSIGYTLAVNGTIGCKELTVTNTGWADYVFKNDYELLSLDEVEEFIKENKHLPGMPTEAEVKENGVNVAEISTKLLQKIEELTLYVLELKKKNDSLQQQLDQIERK